MRACIGLLAVVAALLTSVQSRAQSDRNGAAAARPEREAGEAELNDSAAEAELVSDLLTDGDAEDDLAWLYSSADEYAPSDLAGEPIVAPDMPGPGVGTPREWDPRWRKFGVGNYALVGVGFGVGAAAQLIHPVPDRWRTRNRLDEWGRDHLGYDKYKSGFWARDLSDILLSFNVAFPLLVDSLVVTHWYRDSPVVAREIALITLETMAVVTMLQGLTAGLASRERPYGRDCGVTILENLDDCANSKRYRSYFSGHAAIAFAGATATCSHHASHGLFGSPVADALTCGAAVTSAATVGLMRIVGRQHYVSDVLSGAALGALSGIGIPWLLHYRTGTTGSSNLSVLPTKNGVSVGGTF